MERAAVLGRRARQLSGDWLLVVAAALLLGSLFFTWSHQFSPAVLRIPGMRVALSGVRGNPDGWQVYSVADVFLAVLAGALLFTALFGLGRGLPALIAATGLALVFVIHAANVPPTNGDDVVLPGSAESLRSLARVGEGETVAMIGLGLALAGLALGLSAWRR